jgi:hypothetical protein
MFVVGLFVGLVVGSTIGVFITAIMVASKDGDK